MKRIAVKDKLIWRRNFPVFEDDPPFSEWNPVLPNAANCRIHRNPLSARRRWRVFVERPAREGGTAIPGGEEARMVEKAYRPDYRRVVIRTSDGEIIQGSVNIASKERVSDIFTKQDSPFIVMKDVYFKENRLDTLIVNKHFIVWAEPLD
jgi:hypothetical protein